MKNQIIILLISLACFKANAQCDSLSEREAISMALKMAIIKDFTGIQIDSSCFKEVIQKGGKDVETVFKFGLLSLETVEIAKRHNLFPELLKVQKIALLKQKNENLLLEQEIQEIDFELKKLEEQINKRQKMIEEMD